jgi:hypothetical protein
MNALLALDEMQASNTINMNLAAVTPAALLIQFVRYVLLKFGMSREQTYSSFLQILTEIERLLVMRDDPPALRRTSDNADNVLKADDLGMLMLHLHELRAILWRDRRRFLPDVIKSIAEDIAELAGERGKSSRQNFDDYTLL